MSAQTQPIFSRQADIQWNSYLVTANTTADLTSGTTYLLWAADGTEGGWLEELVCRPTPAGTTTATVLRIWVNNGSTTGTATNNVLTWEITLPAVATNAAGEVANVTKPIRRAFNPGYKVYGTLGTGSTNGWAVTAFGGKY